MCSVIYETKKKSKTNKKKDKNKNNFETNFVNQTNERKV